MVRARKGRKRDWRGTGEGRLRRMRDGQERKECLRDIDGQEKDRRGKGDEQKRQVEERGEMSRRG